MARVAVVHPDLNAAGGAEAVCAHALEALAPEIDLTLITWRTPDLERLDAMYGTGLARTTLTVRCVGEHHHPSWLAWRAVYQHAQAVRLAQDSAQAYDGVVSTYGEIAVNRPAMQYVHIPHYSAALPPEIITGVPTGPLGGIARRLARIAWRGLARGSRRGYARNLTLANSRWTAKWVERAWGIPAVVLWPPLPHAAVTEVLWERRENGFVCIGKLTPAKRVLDLIDVIAALRGRGIDTHIHVVGDGTGPYAEAVRARCRRSEFAYHEGILGIPDLTALLAAHRYGIHGFRWEHFGIGLAQMVRAGCVGFAPRGGGQTELLADSPFLLFESPSQAIGQLEQVLRDPLLQRQLREDLAPVRARLASHRFGPAFADWVHTMLRGAPYASRVTTPAPGMRLG